MYTSKYRKYKACADLYQAYDGHLNMVLSDVEETVTIVEVEEDNEDEAVRVILLCPWTVDACPSGCVTAVSFVLA